MATQTQVHAKTSPCFFCKHDPCEEECPQCVLSPNGDAILPDDPTERDTLLEDIYRESVDFNWSHPGTAGEPCISQPFRGFPVGKFTERDFVEFIDKYHSKGYGWVYEHISPYDREKAEDFPPSYLGVVIIRTKYDGIDTATYTDKFILRLPRWMKTRDETAVLSFIKDVIQQFLNTENGNAAWKDTDEDFNWDDVKAYIPDDFLRSYGIFPVSEAKEHPMTDIMIFKVDQDESFDAPEEDVPLF